MGLLSKYGFTICCDFFQFVVTSNSLRVMLKMIYSCLSDLEARREVKREEVVSPVSMQTLQSLKAYISHVL